MSKVFDGYEQLVDQEVARDIMGDNNFFGIEEAMTHLGVAPKKQERAYLEKIPISKEKLDACRKTHMLVAVFPMSLIDIRRVARSKRQNLFNPQPWFDKRPFAAEVGYVGWRLVRKQSVPGTSGLTWNEKLNFLPSGEKVPTVRVMAYSVIGHFLVTGERLFEEDNACCADVDSSGNHTYLGHFTEFGLFIGVKQDACSEKNIGLASVLRL